MKKFLVLGSAPYIIKWWQKYKNVFIDFDICCINNAWKVVDCVDIWFKSSDFDCVGSLIPSDQDIKRIRKIIVFGGDLLKTKYYKEGSGTMLLNVLYWLYENYDRLLVVVSGSDFIYKGDKTHFYGVGKVTEEVKKLLKENEPELANKAADPLRYGKKWLVDSLNEVKRLYEKKGYKIYNGSLENETLLPFERFFGDKNENSNFR